MRNLSVNSKEVVIKWELELENGKEIYLEMNQKELQMVKKVFCLAYSVGHSDMFNDMQTIYDNDPCTFDYFFDPTISEEELNDYM